MGRPAGPGPTTAWSDRYPDLPDLETTVRVAPDGTRLLFLLNHAATPVTVAAGGSGVDLLTGHPVTSGQMIQLDGRGVMVLREDA